MTPAQRKRFYFPAWHDCAVANDWLMEDGCMLCDRHANEQLGEMHQKVWATADRIAHAQCRAVTPTDLRYACNAIVTGKTSSESLKLNWQVNQVVALFDHLRSPDDMEPLIRYLHPQLALKQGIIACMERMLTDAVWQRICLDAFKTRDWRSQDEQKLIWLLKQQKPGQKTKANPAEPKDRFNRMTTTAEPVKLDETGNPDWTLN